MKTIELFKYNYSLKAKYTNQPTRLMKLLQKWLPVGLLALSANVFGQTTAPKYSNEFLNIGVGARALGMSNSSVASVGDVSAGYWNPAGLTRLTGKYQVGLMHAEYFAGIARYDWGSVATKIDSNSTVGLSVIRFGIDDIPNTIELIDANGQINYDNVSSFSAADYAFLLSYARKSNKIKGFRYGINAKVINRTVGDFANAWGFGLDAGIQYDVKNWHFGLVARDVTSTFNAWRFSLDERTKEVFLQTGNTIPQNSLEVTLPRAILGTGYRVSFFKKKMQLYTELNFTMTTDGRRNTLIKTDAVSIDPSLGLELGYNNLVFVRAGMGNIQSYTDDDNQRVTTFMPNIGLGVKIKSFCIDYALTDIGNSSIAPYSNVFSLRFDINPGKKSAKSSEGSAKPTKQSKAID